MIFFKYYDKTYPFKLEITEPYIAKFSDATDKRNSYKFLFDILFFHLQLISFFRSQLQDPFYNISKIYGF